MSLTKAAKNLFILFLLTALIGCGAAGTSEPSEATEPAESDAEEEEGEVEAGGELRIAYSAQPDVLDPPASSAIVTAEIMGHVFETLITTDSNYNLQPMLADSWEQSEDGRTITFHLREGVLFHNGEEMTADDVVASMNRWKDGVGGRGQFDDAIFEAEDDYTVVLKLPEPLSTALLSIAQGGSSFAAIMPEDIVDNASPESVDEFIGTGPFQFVEWKQDQYIHLTKFDDYQPRTESADGLAGKKEALVDDLYFEFVLDPSTRVAGIQSGEYDFAHEIPFDSAAMLEDDPNIKNHLMEGAGSLQLIYNKKKGLFTDVKAREAVSTALDMDEILRAAYIDERYYTLNHNLMLPQQEEQWSTDIGKDLYNQNNFDKAKQLLEEAGYNGEEITLITSRDYEHMYNGAVVIQEQLQKIGMNINLEIYDWATLLGNINNEDAHDMYVVWLGFKPEPTSLHVLQENNSGWTDDPELDRILEEFRSQPTLEDAKPIYEELQAWNWDYIPATKIGDYSTVHGTRSTVENVQFQDRPIFWNVTNNK